MAGNILMAYGSNDQSITCTLTSLASGSARQSTAVSNITNLFREILICLKVTTAASSVSATGTVNVYAYGSADGGSTYQEGLAGSDGAATLTAPPNLRLIGVLNANVNGTAYEGMFNLSAAFGGRGNIPASWGVVVQNETGAALASGSVFYQGLYDSYT